MLLIAVKTACDSQPRHSLLICIEALSTAESQGIHRQFNNNIERVVATVIDSIEKLGRRAHLDNLILIPTYKIEIIHR